MSEEKKEDAPKPAADPKMILQALEKSAAESLDPAPAPSESQPEVLVPTPTENTVPQMQAAETPGSGPAPEAAGPLITDAMRRLDDLLARFRGPA